MNMSSRTPLPNEEVTIVVEYGVMTMIIGKVSKSRLVWQAAGLNVNVKGSLSKDKLHYEQAANLALQAAYTRHIPLISMRKVENKK